MLNFCGAATLKRALGALTLLSTALLAGCSSGTASTSPFTASVLGVYQLLGDVSLVHDPSIIREGSKYYVLSTDSGSSSQVGFLPILCSSDKVTWTRCGQVFNTLPKTISTMFPSLTTLWAPDVSYFNGLYHVYYAASAFGTNTSAIGVATSPTMDPTDPSYQWTDQGIVLTSTTSSNFNAIDPNIFIDTDSSGNVTHIWMSYGSFWTGIYQREINPTTGMLLASNTTITHLATRPAVDGDPLEGPSLVKHNGYYYLFVSFGSCCNADFTTDTYEIAVGRSTSPNGPFVDQNGVSMLQGGGTILLSGNGTTYDAPGGQSAYIDPTDGDLIAFHALSVKQNGLDYLFVNSLSWTNDWPTIEP